MSLYKNTISFIVEYLQWKIFVSLYAVEISEDIFQSELFNELIKNT